MFLPGGSIRIPPMQNSSHMIPLTRDSSHGISPLWDSSQTGFLPHGIPTTWDSSYRIPPTGFLPPGFPHGIPPIELLQSNTE